MTGEEHHLCLILFSGERKKDWKPIWPNVKTCSLCVSGYQYLSQHLSAIYFSNLILFVSLCQCIQSA